MTILAHVRRFKADERGVFAMMFGLVLFVVLGAVGMLIDYSMMVSERTRSQSIADSAALAAAASGEEKRKNMLEIAEQMVGANGRAPGDIKAFRVTEDKSRVHVELATQYEPVFMGLFGYQTSEISVISEADIPGAAPLNLALVLDTTRSMRGEKLAALKDAATQLVTDIQSIDENRGNARVSLIPFAEYARLNSDDYPEGYGAASWLNIPPDYVHRWTEIDHDASTGCYMFTETESPYWVCDNEVRVERTATWFWEGCVGSRRNGYHRVPHVDGVKLEGFKYGRYGQCRASYLSPMIELTSDLDQIKTGVTNLLDGGYTYMPGGLIWGWRSLDPREPFASDPNLLGEDTNKVLVLMSDGANTHYMIERSEYGFAGYYHSVENKLPEYERAAQKKADEFTLELCSDIKNAGIQIITIAFEIDDDDTRALLQSCASASNDAYIAGDTQELKAVFKEIGTGLARIRLSR